MPVYIKELLDWWTGLHPVTRADFEEIHPELPAMVARIGEEFGEGEAT